MSRKGQKGSHARESQRNETSSEMPKEHETKNALSMPLPRTRHDGTTAQRRWTLQTEDKRRVSPTTRTDSLESG